MHLYLLQKPWLWPDEVRSSVRKHLILRGCVILVILLDSLLSPRSMSPHSFQLNVLLINFNLLSSVCFVFLPLRGVLHCAICAFDNLLSHP